VEWLNYHHLLYFWTVAREGTIARAAVKLRLAQPTISAQIHTLEEQLNEKLFQRQGRLLVLTEMGQVVYRYAEEIFSLGRELLDVVKNRPTGRTLTLSVGISDVVPKLIAYRLMEPALAIPQQLRLVCEEDSQDNLLARLALHQLDIVISDAPVAPHVRIRAFNHRLGDTGISFLAAPKIAARHKKDFPKSLHGAPMLLPARENAQRRALDGWLEDQGIRPVIMGEFEDNALLNVFGQAGVGVFTAPTAIEAEMETQFGVRVIGRTTQVRESLYAITIERRLKHPGVAAICKAPLKELFG